MDMQDARAIIWAAPNPGSKIIYTTTTRSEVSVTKPGKHTSWDFRVDLKYPNKPLFSPTHGRLLIDLYLKRESNPKKAKVFFYALEDVYFGIEPDVLVAGFKKKDFPISLDPPEEVLYYTQLLFIEQDFNLESGEKPKWKEGRDMLMGFIRWVAHGGEIDKIIAASKSGWLSKKNRQPFNRSDG